MKKRNRKPYRKKKIRKPSRIMVIMRIIFVITICSFLFIGFEYFSNINKEFISTSSIRYYIDTVDSISKPKQQLNWQEVAAIDGAKKGNNFENRNEKSLRNIAESFYMKVNISNKYVVKDFDTVIKEINLTSKEEKLAYKNLEKLKEVSIRRKVEGVNELKESFIESLRKGSLAVYKKYGVLPSVTISQAILESDWGRSSLASEYNNYYGIKADKSWKGKVANLTTKENHSDVIKDNFRVYNSVEESVEDLGKFLNENSRYRNNGLFQGKNYIEQAQALEDAGYSTAKNEGGDKIYADLLIDVIKENNLMLIDCELEK
ncbi:glycoside hydrolase family 73 protein [Clostridium sp. LP20]|uniref:glycoside hydrolase family 73 protein n=1 Tax=Clostridium sp. LP20 TaxID=3418665 RepID=UPI003EE5CFBC